MAEEQLPDSSGDFVVQAQPCKETDVIRWCPAPNSQGREADWSSWGPLYTPLLQSSLPREAGAHCTDMDAKAYSCHPVDEGKGGSLKGWEKRRVILLYIVGEKGS